MHFTVNNPWISNPVPNSQAQLRLFCFPYAGGGAVIYYPWSKLLPASIELYSIRLPGRENRLAERPYLQLSPLIEELARVLPPYLNKPFAFFGHSMGALIAFELARTLRRRNGPQPLHLLTSGRRAPQVPDPKPPMYQLPDAKFIQEMRERYNGIPQPVLDNPELLKLFLPVMRSDVTLLDTYHYSHEAPLECSISAFGGDKDPSVSLAELEAWGDQTQDLFKLTMFHGDHFFLQSSQAVVVEALTKDLNRFL